MADDRAADLRYGPGTRRVRVPAPARVEVLHKPPLAPLADPSAAVAAALDAPVAAPPLASLAANAALACIVVCDVTRPVPNGLLLRPILERLEAAGVPREAVTILVATGLHRPNLGEELRGVIGDDEVLASVRVVNHVARDEASLVDLGFTPAGTPVTLHRAFVEADVRVLTGLVEPHFMAGYSGGRKVLAPGIAGHRTIRTLHHHRYMGDPLAATTEIDANPLHRELLAILAMAGARHARDGRAGGTCAVNTVIDGARRLAFVNSGEPVASHAEAVRFARRSCEVAVPEPYDLIVTSAAGAPLDATYYQTVKGMVTPLGALAEEGELVIASACTEGFGSPEFREAQARLASLGRRAFAASLARKPLADVDEWQSQMLLRALTAGRVHLHTDGVRAADASLTGVAPCPDLQGFVDDFVARRGDVRVALIPDGPYVVPACARPA
jgi:nickel-dependent lactate racemase